jgi:ATP-dependent DNA ligase
VPCAGKQSVPTGDDWLHEPKLDDYRLQVAKHGPVILYSRRGRDGASASRP